MNVHASNTSTKTIYPSPPPTLLTVRQFSEKHSAFSQGSLRNLIFNATTRKTSREDIKGNGLDVALVRVGKKILIDEAKFFTWINELQGVAE